MPVGAGQGTFPPGVSIEVFSYAVIGGLTSIAGAVSGVFFFRLLDFVLANSSRPRRPRSSGYSLSGTGLLCILYFLPGGLWQFVQRSATGTCAGWQTATASTCPASWPIAVVDDEPDGEDAPARTRPRSSRRRCHEPAERGRTAPTGRPAEPILAVRGLDAVLRAGADPLRPRPRHLRGRDRRPPRHQRRRQVDPVQVHHQPARAAPPAR